MKKKLTLILTFILFFTTYSYGEIGIEGDLRSYLIADYKDDLILEEYNIDEVVEIASISKIMTYLVTMDLVSEGDFSLDDLVVIDEETAKIRGSSLKLQAGEVFSLEELINSILVISANDSANAIAKHIGGSEYNFARMMNEKAREIGLESAVFYNASGLPIPGFDDQNKMTTRDIYKLTRHIIDAYPQVLETMTIPFIEVESREFRERNTNPLLYYMEGVDGFKTGFTNKAGYCNVATFTKYAKSNMALDNRFITIVMGTSSFEERDRLSRIVADYTVDNYSREFLLDEDRLLTRIDEIKAKNREIELYPRESFIEMIDLRKEKNIKIDLDESLKLPIEAGDKVAKVSVEVDGQVIFETDLVTKEKVKKANFLLVIWRRLLSLFK